MIDEFFGHEFFVICIWIQEPCWDLFSVSQNDFLI